MGVEFFTCQVCEETFPDCGEFYRCDCGGLFCSLDCSNICYDEKDKSTCVFCRGEDIENHTLIAWLLKKVNLTKEEAIILYNKEINRS